MGITLVSPANHAPPAGAGPTPAGSGDSGLPTDFAALLGLQIADAAQVLATVAPAVAEKGADAPRRGDDRAADDGLAATPGSDASLLPFLPIDPTLHRPPPPAAGSAKSDDKLPGVAARLTAEAAPLSPPGRAETPGEGAARAVAPLSAAPMERRDGPEPANIAGNRDDERAAGFAAALAAQRGNPAAPGQVERQAPPVATPLEHPEWGQDLGNRVVWMARNDQQSAQINLNPPQMGPLQITINVNGDQASALFVSPHAEVRQAIQDALPQLREMLLASGINLGQADVGTQAQQHSQGEAGQGARNPRSADDKAILQGIGTAGSAASAPALTQRGRGLVDLFA